MDSKTASTKSSQDEPIIYRPKPKKKLCMSQCLVKPSTYYNKNEYKKNFPLSLDYNFNKNKKSLNNNNKEYKIEKKTKFDFDEISLKEIESDFNLLKARSEIIEVENELINLLRNSTKDNSLEDDDCKNVIKIKRPKNPFFENYE